MINRYKLWLDIFKYTEQKLERLFAFKQYIGCKNDKFSYSCLTHIIPKQTDNIVWIWLMMYVQWIDIKEPKI